MDKRAKLTKKNKFTEQETLRFVREYLNNSCLWSVSNPDYKNKTIKQEKYQNLYLSFKNVVSGIDEIKNKIRILRTTYKQEENKVNSSFLDTNSDECYTPRLAWFSLMKETFNSGKIKSFKKDSRISKQSKNVSIKSQPNTDNFFYVEEISAHFDEVEDDEESFQDDQEDYEGLEDENLEDDKRILIEEFDDYEPPTKKLAIKISNNFESEQEEDTEDTKLNVNEMPHKPAETNEDKLPTKNFNEMFLMSLLGTLDSLSPENAMKARIKIQQILFEIAYDKQT